MNDKNSTYFLYKQVKLDFCYRLDVVVEGKIILELKSCEKIEDIFRLNCSLI
jgi:hypothetical protein